MAESLTEYTVIPSREADDVLHRLLATPQGQADPYPLYRVLRGLAPLHRSALDGVWYASSFAACREILGHPHARKTSRFTVRRHGVDEDRVRMAERRHPRSSMITANPPEHRRLRGVAKDAFLPPQMDSLRSRVARLVGERLDHLAEAGEADVMAALARPLPITVIGELLGVPEEDREALRPLVAALTVSDDPNAAPEAIREAEAASDALEAYFSELMAARRPDHSGDLLAGLVAQRDAGILDGEELYATVVLLFVAGFVTTTNLVGNGLLTLFRHPHQMARLWHDPALVRPAVEEMLRYDPPIQLVHRQIGNDLEVGGHRLRQGELVVTLLGAANRDPARFSEPDRFGPGRGDSGHLAFAWGIHFCLGAHVARLEAELIFAGLRERFFGLELLEQPSWRPGLALRGLDALRVRFTPR